MNAYQKYEPVIGLEVHCQLLTQTKAFAPDPAEYGGLPNTFISPITLAHPGALPKANRKAVEYSMKMGLACHCQITRFNFYDRKNYFYPDLPKGYQITQDKAPLNVGGYVTITMKDGSERNIKLNRIHMEEDAGKSFHLAEETDTLVDYNRAGVPLIEIVTEPDLFSSEEAGAYLTEIRRLVRYLDVCDGNMEEGSMRCDANISIRPIGSTTLGKKVEVKNMNSIRNVMRAIEHEIERQAALLDAGKDIVSETRMFDATDGTTYSLRTKEELNDYRYFPEPDLQPIEISDAWLEEVKAGMPALPRELYAKYTTAYELPAYDAGVLTDSRDIALYFDEVCAYTKHYKAASNWVMGPVKSYVNEQAISIDAFSIRPKLLAELIELVASDKVSFSSAQQKLFPALVAQPSKAPEALAAELNMLQESNSDNIRAVVKQALERYPDKVKEYQNGKKGLLGLFVGEVMKLSGGKADPKLTNQLIKEELGD